MSKKALYAAVTIFLGTIAGAICWAFFFLMNSGIYIIWNKIPDTIALSGISSLLYPVIICVIGGIIIGTFSKRFGDLPQDMNTVLAQVKKSGRYEYNNIKQSFLAALLPLLFGGSIGPEAGLTGVIAGLCTWVGDRLRSVGAQMREITESGIAATVSAIFATPLFGLAVPVVGKADDTQNAAISADKLNLGASKPVKIAIYILSTAGALATMTGLGALFGDNGGLPRFTDINIGVTELIWSVPLALIGALTGWLFYPSGALARKISDKLGEHKIAKSVIAGAILGICGAFLPFTMFAGESQAEELAGIWTTMIPIVLISTGILKVIMTQVCLGLGWRGGHFFPLIFAGISLGYGMASLTGTDPVFCLCAVTSSLLGAVMRQPLMCALLLFLVFPVKAIIVLLVCASLGSLIPIPDVFVENEQQDDDKISEQAE